MYCNQTFGIIRDYCQRNSSEMPESMLNTVKPCLSIFCRKRLYIKSSLIPENTNEKVYSDTASTYHHILFTKIYLQVISRLSFIAAGN